ncbi:MAG: cation-translocating P-type ATPase [Burkholderiales bacterium]
MTGRDLMARQGLSPHEAARRLAAEGPNELASARAPGVFGVALEVLREPMFLLLLGAIALYLVLGDLREALVLAVSIVAVVAISIYQQFRTERTLEALRDLSSPRALVIRGGEERRIAGREVVRGDRLVVHEGDRVPADAVLRESIDLSVDESLLTGESVPVAKCVDDDAAGAPRAGDPHAIFAGTLVVRGHAIAEVVATGPRSEMGRIGDALASIEQEATPLQRETRRVVTRLAVAGVALCVVAAVAYGVMRGRWIEGMLSGVTLAMGVLPEEFPVVLTVFLALGAWRISRHRVLTRRMPAIETLGATTVLCVDKTGTLTENRMQVAFLETPGETCDLRDADASPGSESRELLALAAAASEVDDFDPMERAIHAAAQAHADAENRRRRAIVREYELSAALPVVTHVWSRLDSTSLLVAAKGAPEALMRLCAMEDAARARALARVEALASQGLRVLAVAEAAVDAGPLPDAPYGFALRFRGLVGLADPPRANVRRALQECRDAGIRVVMITGDHPATALAIGRAIGLDVAAGVRTGAQLDAMDDAALRREVASVRLFARVIPEQKLRLVQAFKSNGDVVAMTGDGVNDAPALKAAHIGVAMGGRGTDVAREAAALVLLDDDFTSLVATVRQGRRIYDNIRNAMTFLLAVHIPIAGMGLLPVLAGWPLFMFPVHVVFLEFVIDPACSLVFEAEHSERNVMHRPPRDPSAPLFTRGMLVEGVLLGLAAFAAVATVYGVALASQSEGTARALAFIALVTANLLTILATRSHVDSAASVLMRPNRVFWIIVLAASAALTLAAAWPAAATLFKFESPLAYDVLWAVAAAFAAVVWIEGVKMRRRRSLGQLHARSTL